MIKNITNLGDAALYCDFGEDVNIEKNLEVIKYFNEIKNLNIDGVLNITKLFCYTYRTFGDFNPGSIQPF